MQRMLSIKYKFKNNIFFYKISTLVFSVDSPNEMNEISLQN